MPSNDREVFDHLTASAEAGKQERQIAFLSYAQFAFEKREWIKLYKSKNADAEPSQADIDGWIENITESSYTTYRNAAERFFVDAADDLFADRLEEARLDQLRRGVVAEVVALKDQTIAEVKAAGNFWKQLAIALISTILAPLIIGALIAGAIVYDKRMITGTSLSEQIQDPTAKPPAPQDSGQKTSH